MKKIAALVLALVMVLSCGITGSATEFEKEDNRLISTENIEIKMFDWYIYRIKGRKEEDHHETHKTAPVTVSCAGSGHELCGSACTRCGRYSGR